MTVAADECNYCRTPASYVVTSIGGSWQALACNYHLAAAVDEAPAQVRVHRRSHRPDLDPPATGADAFTEAAAVLTECWEWLDRADLGGTAHGQHLKARAGLMTERAALHTEMRQP